MIQYIYTYDTIRIHTESPLTPVSTDKDDLGEAPWSEVYTDTIHTHTHTHTQTHRNTHKYMHTYTYMHTFTYTQTHTHTQHDTTHVRQTIEIQRRIQRNKITKPCARFIVVAFLTARCMGCV